MSEDEAFIRAIVDSPGDDTPRLVYADWLDERSDPRDPYLRAEAKWAKPWRRTRRPDMSPELLAAAGGLDPVWVARVSRPPAGVCCDHLTLRPNADPIVAADLDAVEERLKLVLPAELRAFLLNHNGGKPKPDGYRARWRKPHDSPDSVAVFFPVFPTTPGRIVNVSRGLEHTTTVLNNGFVASSTNAAVHEKWTNGVRDFVVIAEPGGGLGVIAIGLTGRRVGKVYEFNRTTMMSSTSPKLLADSLADFLAQLTIADGNG